MADVKLNETPLHMSTRCTADELVELIADQWGQDEVFEFMAAVELRFADEDLCRRIRDHFQSELDRETADA